MTAFAHMCDYVYMRLSERVWDNVDKRICFWKVPYRCLHDTVDIIENDPKHFESSRIYHTSISEKEDIS